MQAVNLLPLEARPAGRWTALGSGLTPNRVIPVGGAVIAGIVLLLGGLYVYERSVVHNKQNTLADKQSELAIVNAKAQPIRDAQARATAMSAAVNSIVAGRMVWDSTLGDLARVLPDGVGLTTLQASAAAAAPVTPPVASTTSTTSTTTTPVTPVAPAAPATSFTISGTAPSHVRVALVLDRLALLPWLSGVTLQSSSRTNTGSVTFNAAAGIAGTGGH
jgi:Tfp pilus assembly protein PilN